MIKLAIGWSFQEVYIYEAGTEFDIKGPDLGQK